MICGKTFLTLILAWMRQTTATPVPQVHEEAWELLPAGWEIIGYRSAHPVQAAKYNEAKTLIYEDNTASRQIGSGVYTTPALGGWKGGVMGSWHCVITANSRNFAAFNKDWIPEYNGPKKLWYSAKDDSDILKYIYELDKTKTTVTTFRISVIEGTNGELQMVIPFPQLNDLGGLLDIRTQCRATVEEWERIRIWPVVDYSRWANVKGFPQAMSSDAAPSSFLGCAREKWSRLRFWTQVLLEL